jgi:transposase
LKRIDPARLVFLDEAAANLSMGRSHAWIRRGDIKYDPKPINWGRQSLTMLGAVRLDGWVTMSTIFGSANGDRFVAWVRRGLAPKLRPGDIVILDNAPSHRDLRFVDLIEARGARVEFLPPYSPDLNPIEPAWAIAKKHIRAVAPRDAEALRKAAHAGRQRVKPRHCLGWFKHSGYRRRLN